MLRCLGFWLCHCLLVARETSKTPYRSVSTAQLSFPVSTVQDVPPPNQHLKIQRSESGRLRVLDLESVRAFRLRESADERDHQRLGRRSATVGLSRG